MQHMSRWIAVLALLTLAGCAATPVSTEGPTTAGVSPAASTAASAALSPSAVPSPTPSPGPTPAATDPAAYVKGAPYAPVIDPADFVATIDNPYLPWPVGAMWTYEGGEERNVVVVLADTRMVLGIPTTVVHDQVFTGGELTEDTFDWYAQDKAGNVWYLGEDTKELEGGKVTSTEGSWEAGVDGAQPGIVMLANPTVDEAYRQEYKKGEAEDVAKVIAPSGPVTVKAGTFDDLVVTEETTALEPTIVEHKTYARGVGVVLEQVIKGSKERNELVSMQLP